MSPSNRREVTKQARGQDRRRSPLPRPSSSASDSEPEASASTALGLSPVRLGRACSARMNVIATYLFMGTTTPPGYWLSGAAANWQKSLTDMAYVAVVVFKPQFVALTVCIVHALAVVMATLATLPYCFNSARCSACSTIARRLALLNPHSSAYRAMATRLVYACLSVARCPGVRALGPPTAASAAASGQPGRQPSRISRL